LSNRHIVNKTHRHFDRSCSRLCEQRSGEICYSTSNSAKPTPLLCFFPPESHPAQICRCVVFVLTRGRDCLNEITNLQTKCPKNTAKSHVKPLIPR
jgi:hypothetical protein